MANDLDPRKNEDSSAHPAPEQVVNFDALTDVHIIVFGTSSRT
jgi:hypothetical protein